MCCSIKFLVKKQNVFVFYIKWNELFGQSNIRGAGRGVGRVRGFPHGARVKNQPASVRDIRVMG